MRIIAVFSLLVPLTLPVSAHGQAFGGVGVRAEGMGGAFVAVADDASAMYWNPAGLATGPFADFQVAGGDEGRLFVGAALPVLGVGFYRTHDAGLPTVSSPPGRQNNGSGRVPIRPLTTANTGVNVVQTVASGLVIGTTARLVRGGVEPFARRTTVDVDLGAMVSAWDMRFGVTARNLRQPEFDVDGGQVRMKRQVRVGAALVPRSRPTGAHGPFSLAVDADLTTTPSLAGEVRRAAAGGEYWVAAGLVGVRGGVRWSTLGDSTRGFSGGFTVRLPGALHVEGQLTKWDDPDEEDWTIGARITF